MNTLSNHIHNLPNHIIDLIYLFYDPTHFIIYAQCVQILKDKLPLIAETYREIIHYERQKLHFIHSLHIHNTQNFGSVTYLLNHEDVASSWRYHIQLADKYGKDAKRQFKKILKLL